MIYDPGSNLAEFNDFVQKEGLGSGFRARNAQHTDWSNRVDLRISQEIPFFGDSKGRLYFKIYNLGNMLNEDWGKVTDAQFFSPQVLDASVDPVTGQFIIEEYHDRSIERVYAQRSLWEARLGFDIKF